MTGTHPDKNASDTALQAKAASEDVVMLTPAENSDAVAAAAGTTD
jgi:hypothetical protein